MKIEREESKGTSVQQAVITVEMLWRHLLPHMAPPANRFVAGWCKIAPLEEIIRQVEHIARQDARGRVRNTDEAGRKISAFLRNRREQINGVGVLRFN